MKNLKAKVLTIIALTISFIVFDSNISYAQQDSTQIWHVLTKDGNNYHGEIIVQNDSIVELKTNSLGNLTIKKINIKKMQVVSSTDIKADEIWLSNPQESRYFWAPSAYGLREGEAYYQNAWLFFNQFAVGITDQFSIGLGIVPTFLFGAAETPIWLTPKLSFADESNNFGFGVGGLFGTVLGEDGSSFGITYGVGTFGSRDNNVSIGLGYGYAGGEWGDTPTINVSGMFRTGRRGYFLFEGYLIDAGSSTEGILALGGRNVWNNISLDFGGAIPLTGDDLVVIPWLSLIVSFGK